MADIIFPTDTPQLPTVEDSDQILVSDANDSDISKDTSMLVLATYIGVKLQSTKLALPTPTVEGEMMIVNDAIEWEAQTTFDFGTY